MMLTHKQKLLLKMIYRETEIDAKKGLRIFKTYKGFFQAIKILKYKGLIDFYQDHLIGKRIYHLTERGRSYARRL